MELYPAWPILVAVIVILAAGLGWCVLAAGSGPSHRTTRNVGVLFCEECGTMCTEGEPCPCCKGKP